jgi:predicted acylesterase/phospholipase RssA
MPIKLPIANSPTSTRLPSTLLVIVVVVGASGCGQAVFRKAVPEASVNDARPAGGHVVRYWGDRVDPAMQASLFKTMKEHPLLDDPLSEEGPGYGALIISGGGDCGAYGAGLLCGWTDRGDRPRFRLVTGVSTGALIAPFAFLGPKHDPTLRKFYTTISARDVMIKRPLRDLLRWDSAADSKPLQKLTDLVVTDEVLGEIAAEYAKGRFLYVQTVNLDAQRPVVWDMGAIATNAAAGDKDAAKLFRQVLVASASVPGAFPPQYIPVEAGGKTYDEMHVDGGTVSQMLLNTLPVDMAAVSAELSTLKQQRAPRVYVIRNGWVRPHSQAVAPKLFRIAARSISTMIKSQAETELNLMYFETKSAGIDLYLSYIPDEFVREANEEFDTGEMNRMFDLGYGLVTSDNPWHRAPPRYAKAVDGMPDTVPTKPAEIGSR